MHFTAVESSTLATVSYDEARQLLQLEFRSRAVYHYFVVPPTVHEGLLAASSKGRYFNLAIRGHYAFARIPSAEAYAPVPAQPERGGAPWHAR